MIVDTTTKQLYLGVKQAEAVPHTMPDGREGYMVELEDDEGIRFYPKKEFESYYTRIAAHNEISEEDLVRMIATIYYRRLDTKTVLCTLTMKTGFVLYGFSSSGSPEDSDDYTVGKENAKKNALAQLKSMMSFVMQWGRDRIQFPGVPCSVIDVTDIAPM